jgi:hypothetical protein
MYYLLHTRETTPETVPDPNCHDEQQCQVPIMVVSWGCPFPAMNTSPTIEPHQPDNQIQPELSTTYLDKSL